MVFIHIQKTGGTALRSFVAQRGVTHVEWSEVDSERLASKRVAKPDEFQKLVEQLPRLVSGHFSHYSISRAFDGTGALLFTVLRSPRDRILSLYYFLRAHRIPIMVPTNAREGAYIAKSHTLAEFLACPAVAPTIDNYMVRALSRYTPPALFSPLTRAQVEDAKESLRTKIVFGFQERLDEVAPFFLRAFGLPEEQVHQRNVRKVRERSDPNMEPTPIQEITPRAERLLQKLTCHDQELYDYAASIFKQRAEEWDAVL